MSTLKLRFVNFIPAVVWFIIIYVLLTLPGSDIPKAHIFEVIYFDKWVHTGLFAGLVFLFCWPCRKVIPSSALPFYLMIVASAIAYGIVMEYVQKYFTEDRSFDVTDMVADSLGCVIGYFSFRFLDKRMLKRNISY